MMERMHGLGRRRILSLVVLAAVLLAAGYFIRFPNLPHGGVVVESNLDFKEQGWPGNGTLANPYVIADLSIWSLDNTCISISNTTVYFVIQGCYLVMRSNDPCISFEDVTHGSIEYCEMQTNGKGIHLIDVVDCTFAHNEIYGFACGNDICSHEAITGRGGGNNVFHDNFIHDIRTFGVVLGSMDHCIFSNNTIANTMVGVSVGGSGWLISGNKVSGSAHRGCGTDEYNGLIIGGTDMNVVDNEVWGNADHGIEVSGSYCTLSHNTFFDNGACGIFADGSRATVINNTVSGNLGDGIHFQGYYCTASYNEVYQNGGHGITFWWANMGTMTFNHIHDNSGYGIYIRVCDPINTDNTIENNGLGDIGP